MNPRCLRSLTLVTTLALISPHAAIAESLPDQAPRYCQVRTNDYRITAAVEQGLRVSATFRELVDRINASDVVVYVNADANLPAGVDGRLTFLSAIGGFRYVVVQVNTMLPALRLVSLIGHELQHAREVADTESIIDARSMARAYAGDLGYRNSFVDGGGRTYDSIAAIRAGEAVLREVMAEE